MSNILEQASLVLIPSGYKSGKIYSQIPTIGDGDMNFTRASNATRVNSAGLIEKVRTNLVLQSETLDNASWTKNRSTITDNALVNPVNGATTADYIVEDTATGTHEVIQTFIISAGISYTVSVYAKADTRTKIALVLAGSGFTSGGNGQAIFNLSTGVVISAINGATARISDAGNGWYRCSITKASIDTAGVIALELVDASDNTSYTGNGTSRAAFFGAQFEVSDFGATDYIPTTTAAVTVGMTANVPRLDYLGSSCPRLLLEPQRTNTALYSEQFNDTSWTKGGTTISANTSATLDPSGYNGSDKLVEDSSTGLHRTFAVLSCSTSTAHTASVFVKKDQITSVEIIETTLGGCIFNLNTGTISSGTNGFIEDYGNGWFRCGFTKTTGVAQVGFVLQIRLIKGGTESYTGNGVDGLYLWGAQLEAGSYVTSYIPSLSTSVTRVADAASKTGISSLIGQTQGTLFADVDSLKTDNSRAIAIQGGGSRLGITLSNTEVGCFVVTSAGLVINATFAITTAIKKVALSYQSGSTTLFCNGVLINTNPTTYTLSGSMAELYLGQFEFAVGTGQNAQRNAQAALFTTPLSNAELASITTL